MAPRSWDVDTFERQRREIDEIDEALPALDNRRHELLKRQVELNHHNAAGEDVAGEWKSVIRELDEVASQRKGRLIMVQQCEDANKRMLADVSVEFLTNGEREVLGAIRLKLARILLRYG